MKNIFYFFIFFILIKYIKTQADQIIYEKLNRFVFLSCNNQNKKKNEKIIQSIEKFNPQLMLWIGDLFYTKCFYTKCLNDAYKDIEKNSFYLKLKQKFKIDGIYDDHDYNMNNGDKTYQYKDESKMKFLQYLNIDKDDIRYKRTGSYISKLYIDPDNPKNQIKIIILDTRYLKDPYPYFTFTSKYPSVINTILSLIIQINCTVFGFYCNSKNDILGNEQWVWLEKQLTNSEARVHIIISSIQIFSNSMLFENWGLMPYSLKKLRTLLKKIKPKGLIFLSGDVHFGSIIGNEDDIIEVTSSNVNQNSFFTYLNKYAVLFTSNFFNRLNPFSWKKIYSFSNFGAIDIEYINDDEMKIKTSIKNNNGEDVLVANQVFNDKKDIYIKKNKIHLVNDEFYTLQCKSKLKIFIDLFLYLLVTLWFLQIIFILYKLIGVHNIFKTKKKEKVH